MVELQTRKTIVQDQVLLVKNVFCTCGFVCMAQLWQTSWLSTFADITGVYAVRTWIEYTKLSGVYLLKTDLIKEKHEHQTDETVTRAFQRDVGNKEGLNLKGSIKQAWKFVTVGRDGGGDSSSQDPARSGPMPPPCVLPAATCSSPTTSISAPWGPAPWVHEGLSPLG